MKILNFLNLGENGTKEFLHMELSLQNRNLLQDHGGSAVMFATDMLGHLDVQVYSLSCLSVLCPRMLSCCPRPRSVGLGLIPKRLSLVAVQP